MIFKDSLVRMVCWTGLLVLALGPLALAQAPCDPVLGNPTACENSLPGNDASQWDISGSGDPTIQGFATEYSVNLGQQVHFKIDTTAAAWRLDIYRLGYYAGKGARFIATVNPSPAGSYVQPPCTEDPTTGLIDCGNWSESALWAVPANAVSGVYIARAVRTDNGGASHIVFVVRDDSGNSDILFRTSDTTWQAYNDYGGTSLYVGGPVDRGYKVSYNRPFITRGGTRAASFLMATDYPLIRWLEANGYDVSYMGGADTGRRAAELLEHKCLISSGHDEYWSSEERGAFKSARDAGVNLAFLSGNSIFWKTRWESSVAGGSVPYRTLVCYKETHSDAKIDPLPNVWTGTWRDPRFSPPADGGLPENELMGTIFTVNCCRFDAMQVSSEEGRRRLWRNTSLASLAPNTSVFVGSGTVGHEWNEDLDNGYRPPGIFRLSTNEISVTSYLLDHGSTYGPGTATHSLTLYRHSSGALVFSAGSINFAWGLESVHDTPGNVFVTVDSRMRQAMVNLFADMQILSSFLQPGLVASMPSTDTAAPTASITFPSNGSSFASNQSLTITGTAFDTGGGVIGGVEISLDGGTTWHPVHGAGSWSYPWTPITPGTHTIVARAVDDSGNLGVPSTPVQVGVAGCPCGLFGGSEVPAVQASTDAGAVELGLKIQAVSNARVTGMRFYKGTGNTGTHRGNLWTSSGTLLATALFTSETSTGWQSVSFASPVTLTVGATYVVSYHAPNGRYAYTLDYFANTGVGTSPVRALSDSEGGGNGVYVYSASSAFPSGAFRATNYWVDVAYDDNFAPDMTPPSVTSTLPASGAIGVDVNGNVTATFSEDLRSSSVTGSTFTLRGPGNMLVSATVSYNSSTFVATLDPTVTLQPSSAYTATLKGGSNGVKDLAGNALVSDVTWSFTTGQATTRVTIWSSSTVPGIIDSNDGTPYELGVKFRSSVGGRVLGLRFYKSAANTGTHVGRLWTSSGTQLASVTFTGETASGWQEGLFSSPVNILANTIYVVSYYCPQGRYSVNLDHFAPGGVTNGVLTAVGNSESPNGVYKVSPSGFPSLTYRASNYWVDVVLDPTITPDMTPPTVTQLSPAAGATAVDVNINMAATFNEALNPATVSGSTFTLHNSSNQLVSAAVTYDDNTQTCMLDPASALAANSTFTATLKGGSNGIKDLAGNALLADVTWSFTTGQATTRVTIWSPSTVPGIIDSNDGTPYELGVKFRSSVGGRVLGLRFYKSAANTGTHVGRLWTSSGTQLASVTFTGETASGWQEELFSSPVNILANTIYVVSYYCPQGRYSVNLDYFAPGGVTNGVLTAVGNSESPNGVYKVSPSGFPSLTYRASNYWVDVVLDPTSTPDMTPPTVTQLSPAAGATAVDININMAATFNEALNPATVSGSTFTLHNSSNQLVSAAVTYDDNTQTCILDPASTLAANSTFTATLKGGSNGIKDLAGNPLAADVVWSFATGAAPTTVTLWSSSTIPGVVDADDSNSYELGVKFRASVSGTVQGIRFYKSAANVGTHVGHLWSSTGTQLGSVTFTGETASGWQQALFASPVAISANTIYVVSYHVPAGHYSVNLDYFSSGSVNSGVLTAVAASESVNGVYKFGASGFPNLTYRSANYWVDLVFKPGP